MKSMLVFCFLLASTSIGFAQDSLESQVKDLSLPEEVSSHSEALEQVGALQDRYSPLENRVEIGVAGGRDFGSDSFVNTNQAELSLRYHFTNNWSLAASGAILQNKLNSSADALYRQSQITPDIGYVKRRADLMLTYNLFYGKIRLGFNQNFYFDHFVSLGGGINKQFVGSSNSGEGIVETGFAFWLGKRGSLRLGIRDYILKERSILNTQITNHVTGYLGLGVLL